MYRAPGAVFSCRDGVHAARARFFRSRQRVAAAAPGFSGRGGAYRESGEVFSGPADVHAACARFFRLGTGAHGRGRGRCAQRTVFPGREACIASVATCTGRRATFFGARRADRVAARGGLPSPSPELNHRSSARVLPAHVRHPVVTSPGSGTEPEALVARTVPERVRFGQSREPQAYLPRVGALWWVCNTHQGTPHVHSVIHNSCHCRWCPPLRLMGRFEERTGERRSLLIPSIP